ncbi:Putative filamentous protein [Lymphocystis disease virus 1]|uniref:Putative filamentous protein n=1 Tax=Fish lymphocystis disease virus TaxID=36363 RepID=UPI0000161EA7|nr:Putative filamentous protein [Lymphocystis disease virus 1]
MTYDFRIIPENAFLWHKLNTGDILNRLTILEKPSAPNNCCKALNVKFDAILKEFKLIKSRVEEVAQVAHASLDQTDAIEEKVKLLININSDLPGSNNNSVQAIDARLTELVKKVTLVKSLADQNKEQCTAVQNELSTLNTTINSSVKNVLNNEINNLKDDVDHIKENMDTEFTDFKNEIVTLVGTRTDLTELTNQINNVRTIANTALNKITTDCVTMSDLDVIKTTAAADREICTTVKNRVKENENTLTNVKTRVTALEKNLTKIKTKVTAVENDITKINLTAPGTTTTTAEITKLLTRINEVAEVAHEATATCLDVKTNVTTLENDIKTTVDDVKTNVTTLENDINDVKTNVTTLDDSINNIITRVTPLEDEITKIKLLKPGATTKDVTKLLTRINEIADVAHEATTTCLAVKDELALITKTCTTKLQELEANHTTTANTLTEFKQSLTTLTNQYISVTQAIQNYSSQFDALNQQLKLISTLTNELNMLKAEVATLGTDGTGSALTITVIKNALNWNNFEDRMAFIENEVNVNMKILFEQLTDRIMQLQSIATEAHDFATLLQQTLKNVPADITYLKNITKNL